MSTINYPKYSNDVYINHSIIISHYLVRIKKNIKIVRYFVRIKKKSRYFQNQGIINQGCELMFQHYQNYRRYFLKIFFTESYICSGIAETCLLHVMSNIILYEYYFAQYSLILNLILKCIYGLTRYMTLCLVENKCKDISPDFFFRIILLHFYIHL